MVLVIRVDDSLDKLASSAAELLSLARYKLVLLDGEPN